MDPRPGPARRRLGAAVASALDAADARDPAAVFEALGLFERSRTSNCDGTGLGVRDLCLVLEELGARLCEASAVRLTLEQAAAGTTWHSDAALVSTAATLVGAARRGQEVAARRAGTRTLGGRPLMERQALAHDLARRSVALDCARVGVWQAAWDLDQRNAASHRAPAALAFAAETALGVSRSACQVFGAAGTSGSAANAVYAYVHELAGAHGPLDELWREASAHRFGAVDDTR